MFGNRYQIEDKAIGHGGMGVVYKAFDTLTKRYVALKTLKGDVDRNSIELFQREWSVLAQLSHPNIVDVLDIGHYTEDGQQKPYFVMPLLPGCTLNKLINNSGSRLTIERVVEIVCQASRGLQAAHDRGLVHRDLKPSNLFVMNDDTVKIIDFGIVHFADAESRTSIKGTLHYMAPEQLEMKPATARSDIYSLGVVCYEALTGRKPFERGTEDEVIEAIRSHMPIPVSDLNSAINEQVSRAIHKAMAKQAYHRFSSVREFSDLLQRAVRNEHIEIFDRARIQPRINRISRALNEGDHQLALDILDELQSEGNIDPELQFLRIRAEQANRSKIIHQLIEGARTRMEEDEYPLALQNIQRVLDVDPGNIDALALKGDIERQRSATQIEKWLQIGRQHSGNKLFAKARQAADEVLVIDPSNKSARQLLEEINVSEQELTKLRQEKQRLYDSALKCYRNGEISSALKQLEQVVDLGKRAPGHPNTDAQYLAFYDEVRGERDELHRLYTEGKNAVAAREFKQALEICSEVLRRRPREPLFKALKIETEDLQRQENSAAIAQLHTQIEAEADLDRKFALLKDAVNRFPDEQMFNHSMKLVKERRDLVNSIVSKARHYESQSNFSEASNQWDILRSVYSQYPGLDFEIQRLSRKEELQARETVKARSVQVIDRALLAGDYAKAEELVRAALAESPNDGELVSLQQQVLETSRRNSQAQSLLAEGNMLAASGDHVGAIERLRAARELNTRSQSIVIALLSALVAHARSIAEQEWRGALPFVDEALEIDPTDAEAASALRLVEDMRKREQVERFLMEARDLQTQQKLTAALEKAQAGLREFPGEIRLTQLRNTLQATLAAEVVEPARPLRAAADTVPELAAAAAAGAAMPQRMQPAVITRAKERPDAALFEATSIFRAEPDDTLETTPAFQPPVLVRSVPPAEVPMLSEESDFRSESDFSSKLRQLFALRKSVLVVAAAVSLCLLLLLIALKPKSKPQIPAEATASSEAPGNTTAKADQPPAIQTPNLQAAGLPGASAQPKPLPAHKAAATFPVDFTSNPSPAMVSVDGETQCRTPCSLPLSRGPHQVAVSSPNYSPGEQMVTVPEQTSVSISLQPELKLVRISSDPAGANVSVDGEAKGPTPTTLTLSLGKHKLAFLKDNLSSEKEIEVTPESIGFSTKLATAEKPD